MYKLYPTLNENDEVEYLQILWKEEALTFDYDFNLELVSLVNGTFMYKSDLIVTDSSNEPSLEGDYTGLQYLRACSSTNYLDPQTQLCIPCDVN